ncbi:MAG: helix-turn-helix domain-containing protein, partial [Chloroflexi bacterium]|nr:helix-turn-helix domain-containing protein [Chloroflexota bacterium]
MSIYVSDAVWEHSQQSGSALTVLLALARHANDQGYCFPSLAKLMAETRLSERAVRMHLRGLEEAGEIKTEQGRGRGNVNVYWIIVGPYAQRGEKGQNPAEKGQPAATKGAIQRGEKGQNPAEKGQPAATKGAI